MLKPSTDRHRELHDSFLSLLFCRIHSKTRLCQTDLIKVDLAIERLTERREFYSTNYRILFFGRGTREFERIKLSLQWTCISTMIQISTQSPQIPFLPNLWERFLSSDFDPCLYWGSFGGVIQNIFGFLPGNGIVWSFFLAVV